MNYIGYFLRYIWVLIILFDVAYEVVPRSGKGTGPCSKWFKRHYPLSKQFCVVYSWILLFPAVMICIALHYEIVGQILSYMFFYIPIALHDTIDWLGEHDRYKRFKKGASEKGKELLAKLKPAPQWTRPQPAPIR